MPEYQLILIHYELNSENKMQTENDNKYNENNQKVESS